MASRAEVTNAFDHPIVFSFVITLVVLAWMALLTAAAKWAGLPGLAALTQHP